MFQTFTGSSRRPRNVNLSGRNASPFAKPGQAAVASAQHDRLARHLDRQRHEAAKLLQRRWRGYSTRKALSDAYRQEWDSHEARNDSSKDAAYASEAESLAQLRLLLRFFPGQKEDVARLQSYFIRQKTTITTIPCAGGPWPLAYLRLELACLQALERNQLDQPDLMQSVLLFLTHQIPEETAKNSNVYYHAIRKLPSLDLQTAIAPLQSIAAYTLDAYTGFATQLLTEPHIPGLIGYTAQSSEALAESINCRLLSSAVAQLLRDHPAFLNHSQQARNQVWLLVRLIYFNRHAFNFQPERYAGNPDFVFSVATLLSAVADEIHMMSPDADADDNGEPHPFAAAEEFIQDQISSLVNRECIGSILSAPNLDPRVLSNYILTILRLFPASGDQIRTWLYLGLSPSGRTDAASPSAIKYFWNSARSTIIFERIIHDPRAAVNLLRPDPTGAPADMHRSSIGHARAAIDDQWKVILIFVELYSFVLKIMDDEEFFSAGREGTNDYAGGNWISRDNALPLNDVQQLTTFLKHLGFTMYYHAMEIQEGTDSNPEQSLSQYFKLSTTTQTFSSLQEQKKRPDATIAGMRGVTLDYMKGVVTGLLRMIYERDSRRPFMPSGHWLMTAQFDMGGFIDAVVEEEERRNQVQEADAEDDFLGTQAEQDPFTPRLRGSSRLDPYQRQARVERLQRQQRQASRRRYLQAVAPRLEILQNMPFLIPFKTRVQTFRRFIHMDMIKRRHGFVDAEEWRLSQMGPLGNLMGGIRPDLARHHARIRRNHEFEDAYDQYYDLGAALKEPIQITFVDQFDTQEAGIDGGGVTKEFLTSVTNQAFTPVSDGLNMFSENEQHLLYPNPAAVDQQAELLRHAGIKQDTQEYRAAITGLLQRYEFLGRVIGKCLYEGILIDVGFAGFFLLKWALTGGTGAAPKESGYRANLNDLREFDEGLYQGLLTLKNYPGDVEEDFNLNFTVDDAISLPPATKTVTRDLRPHDASVAVTASNRLVYISLMARHRLRDQPLRQTNAFLRGLGSIILPSWLSMFNQVELQTLVSGGAAPISVPDLRANTIYSGAYTIGDDGQEHESVRMFWSVLEELPDSERRKVLKFVTSTPRAPLLGFSSLNPRFSVRDAGNDETRLPSTSTCVNLLKLPIYTNRQRLKDKLVQAVNSGAGFDLS